jgi:hypothetical protein
MEAPRDAKYWPSIGVSVVVSVVLAAVFWGLSPIISVFVFILALPIVGAIYSARNPAGPRRM